MLTAEPVVQELPRRGVAECGMPASAIVPHEDFLPGVERLDVVEQTPCVIAAETDPQHGTGFRQPIGPALRVDPGILQSTSLAKYAVAFFRISSSRLSRMFLARTRENSLNSAVYSCFGIFFNFAFPSMFMGRYTPSRGRRNFRGSSTPQKGKIKSVRASPGPRRRRSAIADAVWCAG